MNLRNYHSLQEIEYRVCEARAARGLTQAELAQRCALHRTFIGSVERGERNVSLLNLRLIARALRVSIPDLLAADER